MRGKFQSFSHLLNSDGFYMLLNSNIAATIASAWVVAKNREDEIARLEKEVARLENRSKKLAARSKVIENDVRSFAAAIEQSKQQLFAYESLNSYSGVLASSFLMSKMATHIYKILSSALVGVFIGEYLAGRYRSADYEKLKDKFDILQAECDMLEFKMQVARGNFDRLSIASHRTNSALFNQKAAFHRSIRSMPIIKMPASAVTTIKDISNLAVGLSGQEKNRELR